MAPRLSPDHPAMVGSLGVKYRASDALIEAANVAIALRMPLLLTGDAGCGKTDFAYAAASTLHAMGECASKEPLTHFVRSDTQANDLLYRFDALTRFSDAQAGSGSGAAGPDHYVEIQALGNALCSRTRSVVLVDEIDKAQRDLPNDLLTELDKGWFVIPEVPASTVGGKSFTCVDNSEVSIERVMPPKARRGSGLVPLVIVTSNVERRLPDAFLRRCVFYSIAFPEEADLKTIVLDHLKERGGPAAPLEVVENALDVFWHLRNDRNLLKKPTTSEAIAWLSALSTVVEPSRAAERLRGFLGGGRRDWSLVPALGCLVKHRQDLNELLQP